MCISWTRKGLISLMHGITMKILNIYHYMSMLVVVVGGEGIGNITARLPTLQIQKNSFYSPSILYGTISTLEQSTDNR